MKGIRLIPLLASLLVMTLLVACKNTPSTGGPTSTPLLNALASTPASVVLPTATPGEGPPAASAPAAPIATTAAPTSTGTSPAVPTAASAAPAPTQPSVTLSGRTLTITRDDNGKTLTAGLGDRVIVKLGNDVEWTVKLSDQSSLATLGGTPPGDSQAVYLALVAGTTTISGTGAPHCDPGAICPQFRVAFQVTVTVK